MNAALSPAERSAIARKAVATRKARLALVALEPLPPKPEAAPVPKRSFRCETCIRFDVPNTRLWKCLACRRRLCEHGMNPHYLRVDGTGYCRKCAWKRSRPEFVNARLVHMGLSPLKDVKDEPEPSEFSAAPSIVL